MKVLNNLQEFILKEFSTLPEEKNYFYFTGGTCLSLFYLQHRRSFDLDFFTTYPEIISPFSFILEKRLKEKHIIAERKRSTNSFVELYIEKGNDTTVIHLAMDSPFRIAPLQESEKYPGVKIDSFKDISANKILTLFQRAIPRDFIDIYFISRVLDKKSLIYLAEKKDPGFDLYWFGVALSRIKEFSERELEEHLLLKPLKFENFKKFFETWITEIFTQLKGNSL